jgi:formylglycine-generating enzyme
MPTNHSGTAHLGKASLLRRPLLWLLVLALGSVLLLSGCTAWRLTQAADLTRQSQALQHRPTNATHRLLLVGDSTGVGTGASSGQGSVAGYIAQGFPRLWIDNRARDGARFAQVVQQLATSQDRFDAVLIMAGGNDVIRGTDPEELQAQVERALALARQKSDHVVLMPAGNVGNAPFFFPPFTGIMERRSRVLHEQLRTLAEREQVVYVDLFQERDTDPFVARPELNSRDGLHPSDEGYRVWYDLLLAQTDWAERWPASVRPDADRVDMGTFLLDRTEVTIAQFQRYAEATGVRTQAEREGGGFEYVGGWQRRPGWTWRTPDGEAPASPHLPAAHLTHAEAAAYCQWAGGRLPTAAEWISAAYTEQRTNPPAPFVRGQTYAYPTGSSPEGANTSGTDPWPRAAPAGATQAGVNGLHDMGANLWEWVSDQRGSGAGEERRTMGGSWWYGASQMRASVDAWKPSNFYAVYIGMRCAYDRR